MQEGQPRTISFYNWGLDDYGWIILLQLKYRIACTMVVRPALRLYDHLGVNTSAARLQGVCTHNSHLKTSPPSFHAISSPVQYLNAYVCFHFSLGYYSWKDNTLIDYQNWNSGEPDDSANSCGYMMSGGTTWADDGCTTSKRYVCKAPLCKFPALLSPPKKYQPGVSEKKCCVADYQYLENDNT